MFKKLSVYLERRFIPRWMVLMIDSVLVVTSFLFTYMLRFNIFSLQVNFRIMVMQLLAGFPFYVLADFLFPIFKKQLLNGGPVTITHRDIIRYFMTIPEACNLVLEASFIGRGGEIFLFDMGRAIRIYDLAVRMITLSGLIPHKEIKIIETALRPGEKLYEELLVTDEESIATSHEKIIIRKIRPYNYKISEAWINELLENIDQMSDCQLVTRMKEIVPEFVSNNSQYESLDMGKSYLKLA